MNSSSCIFCKIIAHQLPATVVYEDDASIVIQDIAPKAPIHYLIIPKKHVQDVQSLADTDQEIAARLLLTAKKVVKQKQVGDFRLIINSGANAGQKVFHVHVHLLSGKTMHDF